MEQSEAQEAGDDVSNRHGSPPEAKTKGELAMLIEVGQVKDHLPGVSSFIVDWSEHSRLE